MNVRLPLLTDCIKVLGLLIDRTILLDPKIIDEGFTTLAVPFPQAAQGIININNIFIYMQHPHFYKL